MSLWQRLLSCCNCGAAYRSAASTWRLLVDDLCEYIIVDLHPVKRVDRYALQAVTDIAVEGGALSVFVRSNHVLTFLYANRCLNRVRVLTGPQSWVASLISFWRFSVLTPCDIVRSVTTV